MKDVSVNEGIVPMNADKKVMQHGGTGKTLNGGHKNYKLCYCERSEATSSLTNGNVLAKRLLHSYLVRNDMVETLSRVGAHHFDQLFIKSA
jgi:hypothetical protein